MIVHLTVDVLMMKAFMSVRVLMVTSMTQHLVVLHLMGHGNVTTETNVTN